MILRIEHASCDLVVPGERVRFVDHGDGGAAVLEVHQGALQVTLAREQGWSPDPSGEGATTLAVALQVLGRLPDNRPGGVSAARARGLVMNLAEPQGLSVEAAAQAAVDATLDALAATLPVPERLVGPLAAVVGADLVARLGATEARFVVSDDLFDALGRDTVMADIVGIRAVGGPLSAIDKRALAPVFRVLASAGVFRLQAFGTPGGAITTVIRLHLRRGEQDAWVEAPMPVFRTGEPAALAGLWEGASPEGIDLEEISVQVSGRIRKGRGAKVPSPFVVPDARPAPVEGPGWLAREAGSVWVPAGAVAVHDGTDLVVRWPA